MISKEDEYKAEICKITGFALIAPLAKVILNIPFAELSETTISHLLYLFLVISFGSIGIMLIFKGTEILREKRY